MIGHVFASSGATLLALAPSAERPDEYVLVVKTETGYGVASILTPDLSKIDGPTSWMRASYYDHGTAEEMRVAAANAFLDLTWGEAIKELGNGDLTERLDVLVGAIEYAERLVEHRAHLQAAGTGA